MTDALSLVVEPRAEALLESAQELLLQDAPLCVVESIKEAIALVNRAIFLKPLDAKLYAVRAEAYLQLSDVDSAIQDLRYVIVRRDGADAAMRHRLASLLSTKGRVARDATTNNSTKTDSARVALGYFEEAARLDPLCADHVVDCAVACVELKELRRAFEYATRAIKLEATDDGKQSPRQKKAEQYLLRAKVAWALGLTEIGVRDAQSARSLDAAHPEVERFADSMLAQAAQLSSKAMASMRSHNYDDAIKELTAAMSLAPEDVQHKISRGAAYRLRGDLDLGEADLQKAAEAYEESWGKKDLNKFWVEPFQLVRQRNLIWNERALRAATEKSDHETAISFLNQVIEAEKVLVERKLATNVDPRFLLNRGDCYFARGDLVLATADFARALEVQPQSSEIRTRLSMTHYKAGLHCFNDSDFWDAQFEFSEAIKLNPKVAEYFANRGIAHYHQQHFEEARLDFLEALRLDPNLPHVRVRLQQFGGKQKRTTPGCSSTSGKVVLSATGQPAMEISPQRPPLQQQQSNMSNSIEEKPSLLTTLRAVRPPSATHRDRYARPAPGYVAQIPRGFQAVVSERPFAFPKVRPSGGHIPRRLTEAATKRATAEDKLANLRHSTVHIQDRDLELWSVLRNKRLPSYSSS